MLNLKIGYVSDHKNLKVVQKDIARASIVGIDTETTGLDSLTAKVRLIQLATADAVWVLDMFQLPKQLVLDKILRPLFENEHIVKVFQNAKFDLKFFQTNFGLSMRDINTMFDTFIAAKLIEGGQVGGDHNCGLDDLAMRYLGVSLDKSFQKYDWAGTLYKEPIAYAGMDAAILLPLYRILCKGLEDNCLLKVAKIEFECVPALAQMELNGVLIDKERWLSIADKGKEDMYQYELKLRRYFGDINLGSTQQVCQLLSQMTGMDIKSSSKDALIDLIKDYYEKPDLFGKVMDYRVPVMALQGYNEIKSMQQKYGHSFLKHIHKVTGRVHSSFTQIETNTARLSSRDPNLQNIPRESDMRAAFVAKPGHKFWCSDYSQFELRIMAAFSRDESYVNAFENNIDVHSVTAQGLFGTELGKESSEQRVHAKICLAEGSMVLTREDGDVPIEDVTVRHTVWDGVEWVRHDGVVFNGYQETETYDGITATPDHVVYVKGVGSSPIRWLPAIKTHGRDARIARTASNGIPLPYWRDENGNWVVRGWGIPQAGSYMLMLLSYILGRLTKPGDWKKYTMFKIPEERSAGQEVRRDIQRNQTSVYGQRREGLQKLWWAWDRAKIRIEAGVYRILQEAFPFSNYRLQAADRPEGQQRSLRAREHSVCNAETQPKKQEDMRQDNVAEGYLRDNNGSDRSSAQKVPRNSYVELYTEDQSDKKRLDGRATSGLQTRRKVLRVFDILNAGPRHRFTANGRLVANCNFSIPYGTSAAAYAMRLRALGTDITLDAAKKVIKGFHSSHPGLVQWHNRMFDYFRTYGCVRSASGRIRALPNWRYDEYQAQQAAKNMPIQSTNADTIKLAMTRCYRELPEDVSLVLSVHDELVTEIPEKYIKEIGPEIDRIMIESAEEFVQGIPIKVEGHESPHWSKG